MLTQIIAGDSLLKLGKMVHEMRELWDIDQYCGCSQSKEVLQKNNNIQAKEVIKIILGDKMNGIKKEIKEEEGKYNIVQLHLYCQISMKFLKSDYFICRHFRQR